MKEKFQDEEIPDLEQEKRQQTGKVSSNSLNSSNKEHILKYEMLSNVFNESRCYWTSRIKIHSDNFKCIEKITELQAELFSDRQIILEQKHKLYERISKMNNSLHKNKKDLYLFYYSHYEIRLGSKEKEMFMDADLANKLELNELIDNHINFLDQTIKTLDNMIYGIKYRVSMYEMMQK